MDRNEEALEDYTRLLELGETSPAVYVTRGRTLLDLGRPTEAVKDFERALEKQPGNLPVLSLRGRTLVMLGQYRNAMIDLDAVLRAEPNDTQALIYRGIAHEALRSYELAIKDFSDAIDIDSGTVTADIYYKLGRAYLLNRQFDKAINVFSKVISMQQSHGLAHAKRGVAKKELGQYLLAREDFRKALQLVEQPPRIEVITSLLKETETLIKDSTLSNQLQAIIGDSPERVSDGVRETGFW
jgi:tetratricopeptide (TPR) repeat protein